MERGPIVQQIVSIIVCIIILHAFGTFYMKTIETSGNCTHLPSPCHTPQDHTSTNPNNMQSLPLQEPLNEEMEGLLVMRDLRVRKLATTVATFVVASCAGLLLGVLVSLVMVPASDTVVHDNTSNSKFQAPLAAAQPRLMVGKIHNSHVPYWMAFHDVSNKEITGADYYEQVWEDGTFYGVHVYDHILDVFPCHQNSWAIQAGSHEGVFVMLGASRGCKTIAMEGNPVHIPLMGLSAQLNGFQDRFHVYNTVLGDREQAVGFLGDQTFFLERGDAPPPEAILSHMTTVDATVLPHLAPDDIINLLIVDVEGVQEEVLLGSATLIEQQRVLVWEIEVWTAKHGQPLKSWPGLELLKSFGYRVFFYYEELHSIPTHHSQFPTGAIQECNERWPNGEQCLFQLVAVREDVAPMFMQAHIYEQ